MARKSNHKKKSGPPLVIPSADRLVHHPGLPVPVKKIHWKSILAACISLGLILILFIRVEQALDTLEAGLKPARHSSDARLQAINEQMDSLHEKFSLLLAESVEMKLKALSKDMEAGKLDPDDAHLFGELEKELQLLQQYSATRGPGQLESARLEHARFKPLAPPAATDARPESSPDATELSRQISRLRNMVYLSLTALGICLVILAGYWSRPTPGLPDRSADSLKSLPKPDDKPV